MEKSLSRYLSKKVVEKQEYEDTIEKLWLALGIPKTDQTCFRQHYFNNNSIDSLIDHIHLLEKYRKRTYVVLKRIEVRETLLSDLHLFLHKENLTVKEFTAKIPKKLLQLREATILVLKGIRRWRKLMWSPQAFLWNSENYILKVGKDYEALLDSLMFVKLQIFVADFIFFIPQSEPMIVDMTGEDKIYKDIANKLIIQSPIKDFE